MKNEDIKRIIVGYVIHRSVDGNIVSMFIHEYYSQRTGKKLNFDLNILQKIFGIESMIGNAVEFFKKKIKCLYGLFK